MKRTVWRGPLLVAAACAFILAPATHASAARVEAVLSWDDGAMDSYDHAVTGFAGQKLAVMFQAPEWANWVTEIHIFIADDQSPNSPSPFGAYIWRPDGGTPLLPGELATGDLFPPWDYDEDAWLEIVLSAPLDITDAGEFPDRVFFVGVEWLHRLSPYLGEDHSAPVDQMSWRFNWSEWELRDNADMMVRAVVSDTLNSAVNCATWSQMKALFR